MRICLLIFATLVLQGCKPYGTVLAVADQSSTYTRFRESQKTFNTPEGALKYIDRGNGPVIVLLHGVPTSSWLYRKMITPLAKAGYRVIVPDMLGFGNSDSPEGYEIYNEAAHAQRILALMSHLNITKWTHVMHDAGGLWTWEIIKQEPQHIEKLVILNSVIYESGFSPPMRFKKGIIAKSTMWAYRKGITTNMMLKGLFEAGLNKNNLSKADVEGYKVPLREGKTRGMYYFFSQTCNALPDYSEVIDSFKAPAMIVWGKNDSFLKLDPQLEILKKQLKIDNSTIHSIDAKHFIQEERPEQIVDYILDFLN